MNKELKELIEICEELRHRIIDFGYSGFDECYVATIEVNELGDSYKAFYQDGDWVVNEI